MEEKKEPKKKENDWGDFVTPPDFLTDMRPPVIDVSFSSEAPSELTRPHTPMNPLHYVVIGETGVGKSVLCNLMLNKRAFHESRALTQAGTTVAKTMNGVNPEGECIFVTDTQGFLDP